MGSDADGILDNNERGRLTVTVKNTGTETLTQANVAVTASNPAVVFLNGASVDLPALAPNQTATVQFPVTAAGLGTYSIVDFAIKLEDAGLGIPGQIIAHHHAALNYNESANASADDDAESANTVWTTGGVTPIDNGDNAKWRRVAEGLTNHYWHGPNVGAGSDQYLVSPALATGWPAVAP